MRGGPALVIPARRDWSHLTRMKNPGERSDVASLPDNPPVPAKGPRSLGQLAQRISAWTTNCLLTAMLLVVALVVGREVLHSWRPQSAPSTSTVAADALGNMAAPHVLEFGDQAWAIERQEFAGPPAGVPAALQTACRSAIASASPRGETADAAERELLTRLAKEKPVAEEPGQWRLYEWTSAQSVLIGTRAIPAEGAGGGTILAETAVRVVIWGIAVPVAENRWTMYLFRAGGTTSREGKGATDIPLPPGGRRLVAIRAVVGGAITAFSLVDGDAARGFYDRWFAEHGWTAASAWRRSAAGWHARYELRSGEAARAVDVRLGIDAQGSWSGLVLESQLEKRKP
jgi:hypothetical protein